MASKIIWTHGVGRRRCRILGVMLENWLTVGYDADGDEIEDAVIVEIDYSPADHDVGIMEESFNVTRVRYVLTGGTVRDGLIHRDMVEAWEEQAAEFVADSMEGERDAEMEATLDERRDPCA